MTVFCRAVLLSFCIALPASVLAQVKDSPADLLQEFVDRHELAGAVAVVADKSQIISTTTVGFSDVDNEVALKPDAVFWIASQSKGMTATADSATVGT